MKVFVVGLYLEEDLIEKYNELSNDSAKISVAAIKYSKLIKDGFEENLKDVEHIFIPSFGMFPQCKKMFWTEKSIGKNNYLRLINVFILKQLSIIFGVFFSILKWKLKNRKEDCYVVFTFVYLPFLISVFPFRLFTKIKFVNFVPDLPSFSFTYSQHKNFLIKKITPVYVFLTNKLTGLISYYVFITKYMTDIFPNKPFTIIEGLTNFNDKNNVSIEKSRIKAIMYSGALFEKYGIKNLIDAFVKIEGDYQLWLFGSGDMVDYIQSLSQKDKRIMYYGIKPNSEVIIYQKKATLLINPRFSNSEFTKFSFPSKLVEYLSSGTPVITTRLLGIPDDYNDKFYFIDDESVEGIKNAIEKYISLDGKELLNFGENGKNFVHAEKNYKTQIKKLINNLTRYYAK